MATASNLMLLALDKLVASKTNPRKAFHDVGMKELADSIKANGVLQPIIVRPLNGSGRYEVVVGERRFRATKQAGLTEIPAIVRKMEDAQAMELQIVENLQRQDVHELEEGLGYKALLAMKAGEGKGATPLYTIDTLAAKVGKSTSYIYQRLKLADLSEDWQKEWLDNPDRFTAGHAILVARLKPELQLRLRKEYWKKDWQGAYPSVRNIDAIIQERILQSLDAAPFKKDVEIKVTDASVHPLVVHKAQPHTSVSMPYAPPCVGCQFNSATLKHDPAFDPKKPQCLNPPCYDAKMATHLKAKAAELKAQTPSAIAITRDYQVDKDLAKVHPNVVPAQKFVEVKKTAKGAVPALVVDGRDRGQVTYVVPAGANGKVPEQRTAPSVESRRASLKDDMDRATRLEEMDALAKAFKIDDTSLLDVVAHAVERGLDSNGRKKWFGEKFESAYGFTSVRKVLAKSTKAELLQALAIGLYGGYAAQGYNYEDCVIPMLKHFNVDRKAVAEKVRRLPEFQKRTHSIKEQEQREAARAKAEKAAPRAKPKATGKGKGKAPVAPARASAAHRPSVKRSAPIAKAQAAAVRQRMAKYWASKKR